MTSEAPRSSGPPSAGEPEADGRVLEVEVLGLDRARGAPPESVIAGLCTRALAAAGIEEGHLAVEFVDAEQIAELNLRHRGVQGPTDVLSFPVDGVGVVAGPRELGDVVICIEHTADVPEAIVHGALHLAGLDHETDAGEMLALQDDLMAVERGG